MRICLLAVALSAALCGTAHAQFTVLATPGALVTKISGNGAYAVGSTFSGYGFRWTASSGQEELLTKLDASLGINNAGTVAGSTHWFSTGSNNLRDRAAMVAVGGNPVRPAVTLQTNSTGYDVSDDGTVVGLSYGDNFVGPAQAFIWTAANGMSVLPVNRPGNYSRANAISSDGHVIGGWNDQDDGFRTAVIWQNGVALDVADTDGNAVGEADGVSSNGTFVVGSSYTDSDGNSGSWRWSSAAGVQMIPGMAFAFGVSDDGNTVVGSNGFFDDPPRAAMIWHHGSGTQLLVDYLSSKGIAVPTGWDPQLAGGFGGISANGQLLGGWSYGPSGLAQSYVIRLSTPRGVKAQPVPQSH